MKTAILYARVATLDECIDRPTKLDLQLDELLAFCKKENIQVEICYREIGSGANFNRRVFSNILLNIERGYVKADLLLFTSWDRFSRNAPAALEMIKTLRKLGLQAKSINELNVEERENLLRQALKTKKSNKL